MLEGFLSGCESLGYWLPDFLISWTFEILKDFEICQARTFLEVTTILLSLSFSKKKGRLTPNLSLKDSPSDLIP